MPLICRTCTIANAPLLPVKHLVPFRPPRCHLSNASVQFYNLSRWGNAQDWSEGTMAVIKKAMPKSAPPAEGVAASGAVPK